MAGSGVSVGGTPMLRTRRRDVSIKPNRRLDRKSSRGMIYENEELRLRTININAEVEQGQNDIKKLRKENEQLRREIWSLRDEYDKLEELVKNQSSQGSSDELEGRSGEENNVEDASYTDEDVVEEEEEEEDEEEEEEEIGDEAIPENCKSQEEYLENAENQKISSEKMNSSIHRLHVEFDDLSVVDEEEELKKEKEKKDSVLSEDSSQVQGGSVDQKTANSQSQDLSYCYFNSPSFDVNAGSLTAAEQKYFNDSPFVFPNPSDPNYPKMLPIDNSNIVQISSPSKFYNGPLTPLPNLDTPAMGPVESIFGQNEIPAPQNPQISRLGNPAVSSNYSLLSPSGLKIVPVGKSPEVSFNPLISDVPSFPERRNIRFKQPVNFFNDTLFKNPTAIETPNSGDTLTQNGWDFNSPFRVESTDKGTLNSSAQTNVPLEKPKQFFAPMPSKLRMQRSLDDNKTLLNEFSPSYSKALDTATSSSSEKTSSTVISRNRKGAADLYVNGLYPLSNNNSDENHISDFLSSENLLVEEVRNISRQSSNNPLVKSLSCQDLSSDPQSLPFAEKLKMFNFTENSNGGIQKLITKSDNTLDSIPNNSSRPFKSQLNVTLKLPKQMTPSPNTPEIPKLPAINYRFFNNPFLQSYQNQDSKFTNFNIESPATRPLSVQVNDEHRNPLINNNFNFKSNVEDDQRLLLMAASQFRNLDEKNCSRRTNIGFEVTSFEGPSPQTLLTKVNPGIHSQRLYQNIPNGHIMFPGNLGTLGIQANKVPAQTQTSIDGDSHVEENGKKKVPCKESQGPTVPGSPLTLRRKRTLRKERSGSIKDKRPLSPAAQRRKDRLRKQNSVTSSEPQESPAKTSSRTRKFSITTSTSAGDVPEKNESRSSSSGQDSPQKAEQRRRVSLYFNSKKRPSIVSTKITDRRSSIDNIKDRRYSVRNDPQDATTTNSERERTNSVSSRDTVTKGRKMSTGSGKVPWCACWGNGCV